MPKERILNLEKYNISENRYLELKYFCRQHREKEKQLQSLTGTSPSSTARRRYGKYSDKTANLAIKRAQIKADMELVEQTAKEANSDIYQYIIKNVVDGVPYEHLGVPVGRRQFYEARRKFFVLLSMKKK